MQNFLQKLASNNRVEQNMFDPSCTTVVYLNSWMWLKITRTQIEDIFSIFTLNTENNNSIKTSVLYSRITKTLSYMVYIIHCNSCIYYKLSAWQAFGQIAYRMNNRWYLNKWVYNNQGKFSYIKKNLP